MCAEGGAGEADNAGLRRLRSKSCQAFGAWREPYTPASARLTVSGEASLLQVVESLVFVCGYARRQRQAVVLLA